jgi:hypothetical protein
MSETSAAPAPDAAELAERARTLRARFGEFRGRL